MTPDYEPYIDIVNEGIGVCLGGNGYGAKSCDEMGNIAANLILLNEWKSDIPKEKVNIKWSNAN